MRIELRLKSIMRKHNLLHYGIETKMANELHLNRQTIRKLLHNKAVNPNLDTLSKICGWLVENGVPSESLPGDLFGVRPSGLWAAIGDLKNVACYLGLYNHGQNLPDDYKTIARYDAAVLSKIINKITSSAELRNAHPVIDVRYVPFQNSPRSRRPGGAAFEFDKSGARHIYRDMRKNEKKTVSILLGSQRVNYLVEYFVADLFGLEPFKTLRGKKLPPLFLCYRGYDRHVPSCFGGKNTPRALDGAARPGMYYQEKKNDWKLIEWNNGMQGCGAVFIIREETRIEIALFGLSGRSTSAIGNALITHPHKFYPDFVLEDEVSRIPRGREVYGYACKVEFDKNKGTKQGLSWIDSDPGDDEVTVMPILHPMLNRCVAGTP